MHLQLTLLGLRSLRKNINNERGPVGNAARRQLLHFETCACQPTPMNWDHSAQHASVHRESHWWWSLAIARFECARAKLFLHKIFCYNCACTERAMDCYEQLHSHLPASTRGPACMTRHAFSRVRS